MAEVVAATARPCASSPQQPPPTPTADALRREFVRACGVLGRAPEAGDGAALRAAARALYLDCLVARFGCRFAEGLVPLLSSVLRSPARRLALRAAAAEHAAAQMRRWLPGQQRKGQGQGCGGGAPGALGQQAAATAAGGGQQRVRPSSSGARGPSSDMQALLAVRGAAAAAGAGAGAGAAAAAGGQQPSYMRAEQSSERELRSAIGSAAEIWPAGSADAEVLRRVGQYMGGVLAPKGESLLMGWHVRSVNEWGVKQRRVLLLTQVSYYRVRWEGGGGGRVAKYERMAFGKVRLVGESSSSGAGAGAGLGMRVVTDVQDGRRNAAQVLRDAKDAKARKAVLAAALRGPPALQQQPQRLQAALEAVPDGGCTRVYIPLLPDGFLLQGSARLVMIRAFQAVHRGLKLCGGGGGGDEG